MANYTLVSLQLGKYHVVLPTDYFVLTSTGSYTAVSSLTAATYIRVMLPGASTPFGQLGSTFFDWTPDSLTPLDSYSFVSTNSPGSSALTVKPTQNGSAVYVDLLITDTSNTSHYPTTGLVLTLFHKAQPSLGIKCSSLLLLKVQQTFYTCIRWVTPGLN